MAEENREEWRERKLQEAEAADGTPIPGHRSSVVRAGGKVYKALQPLAHSKDYKLLPDMQKTIDWELPTLVKRTPRQRTEHVAKRLFDAARKDASGTEMQLLLQRIQSQLWAEGKPVPFDEVLRVAQDAMARAEIDEQEKHRKMVSH